MTRYLLWLLLVVVASPLMMFFMMRGMAGGESTDRDISDKNTDNRYLEHHQPASTLSRQSRWRIRARIANLERENADVHAARDHAPGSNPMNWR